MLATPAAAAAALYGDYLGAMALYQVGASPALAFGTFTVIAALVAIATERLLRLAKHLRLADGLQLLSQDARPPVVFLRAFFEDRRELNKSPVGRRVGGPELYNQPNKLSLTVNRKASVDISLARAFARVGPFVAIGKPRELLAPEGAARLYVVHDHWQEVVKLLVDAAAAIVIQPEGTEGTSWEFALIVSQADMRRVLMIVPNSTQRPLGYERVRGLIEAVLPATVPEHPPPCDAFMFDRQGRATPLNLGRGSGAGVTPFIEQVRALASSGTGR
jgi:hypothetical protein